MRVRHLVWGVRWPRLAQLLRVAALPVVASAAHAKAAGPSVALYYGANPPVEALSSFDVVVLEPDGQFDPHSHPPSRTQWFAYVSVGEVNPHRTYYPSMPRAWMPGVNEAWASYVVDQTAAGWPAFFVERVVTPLWNKGYRGWDASKQRYTEVPQTDRVWLLAQARTIRDRYGLPVLSIDYCRPGDANCAADAVTTITADGVVPYVTDGALSTVGVGLVNRGSGR